VSLADDITAPYTKLESWAYDAIVADAVLDMREALWSELAPRVQERARIADVGCGGGQLALTMAEHWTDASVTGVDLSAQQVERATRRARSAGVPDRRLRFVEGSALELPFDDASFDVVVSIASIKHWPDQARGLAECVRVLVPEGKLIVVEADRGCRLEDADRLVGKFRTPRVLHPLMLAMFRTWVAGQSLDLTEMSELAMSLPVRERAVRRIEGAPGLVLFAVK